MSEINKITVGGTAYDVADARVADLLSRIEVLESTIANGVSGKLYRHTICIEAAFKDVLEQEDGSYINVIKKIYLTIYVITPKPDVQFASVSFADLCASMPLKAWLQSTTSLHTISADSRVETYLEDNYASDDPIPMTSFNIYEFKIESGASMGGKLTVRGGNILNVDYEGTSWSQTYSHRQLLYGNMCTEFTGAPPIMTESVYELL